MTTRLKITRTGRKKTTIEDVRQFAANHKADNLIIEINPVGIGDAFADYLEAAGFQVERDPQRTGKPKRASLSSMSSV